MRRALGVSAFLIYAVGTWTILILPVADGLQMLGVTVWTLLMAVDYCIHSLSQRRCRRIRVYSDGSASVQDSAGVWQPTVLSQDCIVLPKYAWLKLTSADGTRYYELLRGSCRESEQWRRLQVIWRHMGSGA
jgi:hypothetical protein